MIKSKSDYKKYVESEKERYYDSYSKITFEHKKLMKFLKIYRKNEYFHNCKKSKILLKYIDKKYHKLCSKYNIYLPINTIDIGLLIIHIGPIYVNENAKIGKNLRLHPMTTIASSIAESKAPTIKDGVWIGPGARLYGNITIGNNVVIGTNSVVNKSFKDNMTIAGVPAKKINNKKYEDYFKKEK